MKKKLDKPNDSLVQSKRFDYSSSFAEGKAVSDSIRLIVGDDELCLNPGLWRTYWRECPDALRYAIQKWWALDPIRRRSIKHPPAWLTDRYKCAKAAFALERKSK
jgi:hypothetical protein